MKNNLKQIRKKAKLTLDELAKACNTSKSSIHGIEDQNGTAPKITTAYAIAKVLNKSVYDIWPDETKIVEETFTVRTVVRDLYNEKDA